jgi:hypothetical protein
VHDCVLAPRELIVCSSLASLDDVLEMLMRSRLWQLSAKNTISEQRCAVYSGSPGGVRSVAVQRALAWPLQALQGQLVAVGALMLNSSRGGNAIGFAASSKRSI